MRSLTYGQQVSLLKLADSALLQHEDPVLRRAAQKLRESVETHRDNYQRLEVTDEEAEVLRTLREETQQ